MSVNLTICIPTYNGAEYLPECLDSVLAQTFNDFEVLIVDDCSSDQTLEIVREYANKDSRVRTVRNGKNLGLVDNWNQCIDLAQGDWIKFVFQDDIIEPICLEKMMSVASDHHPFIVCKRDFIFDNIDQDTKEIYQKYLSCLSIDEVFSGKINISGEDITNAIIKLGINSQRNFIGEPTSVLLHKSIFNKYSTFNSSLIQICDYEFWIRVGINTGIYYVPECLAHFRIHNSATSAKNRSLKIFRMKYMDQLILKYEMATNPYFKKIKDTDANSEKLLSPKKLAASAHWIYGQAKLKLKTDNDQNYINAWNEMNKAYPKINKSVYFYLFNFKAFLNDHIFWRFNKKLQ